MQIGAIIKRQGVTFATVVVKQHVLQNSIERENFREQCSSFFPGMPILLMAQNSDGTPTYHGRDDLIEILANVPPSKILWKQYFF